MLRKLTSFLCPLATFCVSAAPGATTPPPEFGAAPSESPIQWKRTEWNLLKLSARNGLNPVRAASAWQKPHPETRTIEIVPGDNTSDTPFFYGRLKETGELFILRYEDAQGLAGDMLDL